MFSIFSLLGVILDNNLKVDAHIKSLCRKAAQKLSALSRITNIFHMTRSSYL